MISLFNIFLLVLFSSILGVEGQDRSSKYGYGKLMFGSRPATDASVGLYQTDTGIDKLLTKIHVDRDGNFTFLINGYGTNNNEYYIRILENGQHRNENYYFETIITLPNNLSPSDYNGNMAIYRFGVIDLNRKPIRVFNRLYQSSQIYSHNPTFLKHIHTFSKFNLVRSQNPYIAQTGIMIEKMKTSTPIYE